MVMCRKSFIMTVVPMRPSQPVHQTRLLTSSYQTDCLTRRPSRGLQQHKASTRAKIMNISPPRAGRAHHHVQVDSSQMGPAEVEHWS